MQLCLIVAGFVVDTVDLDIVLALFQIHQAFISQVAGGHSIINDVPLLVDNGVNTEFQVSVDVEFRVAHTMTGVEIIMGIEIIVAFQNGDFEEAVVAEEVFTYSIETAEIFHSFIDIEQHAVGIVE